MKANFEKMTKWELEKAMYILVQAKELGMDMAGYGELDVNPNSGYTYLWLEDYDFSLFMPINCDLKRKDVYMLYTDFETGEETEESLEHFENIEDIYEFINTIKNEI